jgi:hypothetical protein
VVIVLLRICFEVIVPGLICLPLIRLVAVAVPPISAKMASAAKTVLVLRCFMWLLVVPARPGAGVPAVLASFQKRAM